MKTAAAIRIEQIGRAFDELIEDVVGVELAAQLSSYLEDEVRAAAFLVRVGHCRRRGVAAPLARRACQRASEETDQIRPTVAAVAAAVDAQARQNTLLRPRADSVGVYSQVPGRLADGQELIVTGGLDVRSPR